MGTPSNTMTERETYDQMVGLFLRDHPEYLQQEGAVEQRWLAGEPEPYLWLNYETSKAFLRWGLARDLIPPSHQPRAYALLSTTTEEEAQQLYLAHYREPTPRIVLRRTEYRRKT